ncbi:transcriptional regulator [Staphylococcus microti]|uniref:Transcriptional antiterminator n=1 Tax=Staphylococcus microti TaxID=569857 RepID=A0A0D6XMM7_9STAP|nr:transcription antiterminator [Staphylococcus microti]KIX89750.1 transcriptional regulator [Staphylococcus microti]PNZ82054.1 transcription antiterminator [Staphylococcus microti]SUM57699.1 transcriptional antiterminator [Staphylococcus microti]
MSAYKIVKVLNNNVLICKDNGTEVVLVGKGIGFNKKPGTMMKDSDTIEKVFKLQNKSEQDHYLQLMDQSNDEEIRVVIESVQIILAHFNIENNESFIVSLTDHLIFALKRVKNGQLISNPFLSETKYSYPEAYQIAKRVVARLNLQLNIAFPEDEVGFIALHIASQIEHVSVENTKQVTELINRAVRLIEHDRDIRIDVTSLQYQRFIRHMHFLLQRLKKGERATIELSFERLLKEQYPLCYNVAVKIIKMIQSQMDVDVYEAEVAYLTMHIQQLVRMSQQP